jgi:hypothetical protein
MEHRFFVNAHWVGGVTQFRSLGSKYLIGDKFKIAFRLQRSWVRRNYSWPAERWSRKRNYALTVTCQLWFTWYACYTPVKIVLVPVLCGLSPLDILSPISCADFGWGWILYSLNLCSYCKFQAIIRTYSIISQFTALSLEQKSLGSWTGSIRKVPDWNLNRVPGYPDWDSAWFSSDPTSESRDMSLFKFQLLSTQKFPMLTASVYRCITEPGKSTSQSQELLTWLVSLVELVAKFHAASLTIFLHYINIINIYLLFCMGAELSPSS